MQGTARLKGAAKHFEYTISFFLLVFFFNQGNLSTIHDGLGKKKIRDLHSSQSLPRMIEFICLYFFSDTITFLGAILCKETAQSCQALKGCI